MNYEQKYKEAMSFLKDLRTHMPDYCKEKIDGFFPELRESEDERIRREIISFITDARNWFPKEETKSSWIAWLEKQGEQILANSCKTCKDEQNSSWNEEDSEWYMVVKESILERWKGTDNKDLIEIRDGALEWLKSLKERVQPQSKQEWSEEDEVHRQWILECLADGKRKVREYSEQYQSAFDWLKSLKPNHWKPSEEQITSLGRFIEGVYGCADFMNIKSLYNDLKKL